jgi:phage repressor protein C with HTH and peptisase S24 domain
MAEPSGFINVPAAFVPHDRVMAFQVQGECLSGDGIHDGDHVLVDPERPVADGDIAVIRTRRGPLVKHLHRAHRALLKLCTLGPPMTTRRAPRRDAMTPSARNAANAWRMVPRDTEYRSASSLSEGSLVPAA